MSEEKPVTGRARPKKERREMAAIRWMWTFILPGIAFAIEFLSENFMNLGIAKIPIALVVGATAYSIKKYYWPDTKF